MFKKAKLNEKVHGFTKFSNFAPIVQEACRKQQISTKKQVMIAYTGPGTPSSPTGVLGSLGGLQNQRLEDIRGCKG